MVLVGYKKLPIFHMRTHKYNRNKTPPPLGVTLHDLSEANSSIAGGVQVEVQSESERVLHPFSCHVSSSAYPLELVAEVAWQGQQGAVAARHIQSEAADPEATVIQPVSGQSLLVPGPHGVFWILHCVSWHWQ